MGTLITVVDPRTKWAPRRYVARGSDCQGVAVCVSFIKRHAALRLARQLTQAEVWDSITNTVIFP
jgi:hypothetical protein